MTVESYCDLQDLQSRNLVFENLLGLVEVSQHNLHLSVMNHFQLIQIPLVPLYEVLFMRSVAEADMVQR